MAVEGSNTIPLGTPIIPFDFPSVVGKQSKQPQFPSMGCSIKWKEY